MYIGAEIITNAFDVLVRGADLKRLIVEQLVRYLEKDKTA
jgi:hypothetical protein